MDSVFCVLWVFAWFTLCVRFVGRVVGRGVVWCVWCDGVVGWDV
jgi:hypothetical protein